VLEGHTAPYAGNRRLRIRRPAEDQAAWWKLRQSTDTSAYELYDNQEGDFVRGRAVVENPVDLPKLRRPPLPPYDEKTVNKKLCAVAFSVSPAPSGWGRGPLLSERHHRENPREQKEKKDEYTTTSSPMQIPAQIVKELRERTPRDSVTAAPPRGKRAGDIEKAKARPAQEGLGGPRQESAREASEGSGLLFHAAEDRRAGGLNWLVRLRARSGIVHNYRNDTRCTSRRWIRG